MTRVPLRACRKSFCTTSLCACGQYHDDCKRPAIDNVADQINRFGFVVAEEIQQLIGLAATRTQMDIGNKNRAKSSRGAFRHDCRDPDSVIMRSL